MAKIYVKGNVKLHKMMQAVLDEHHTDLKELDVRVAVDLVEASKREDGEPSAPAITANGYPAVARIRKTTVQQRLRLPFDAIIEIDSDWLGDASEEEVAAMFDHELEHLEIVRDEHNTPQTCDDLRPKLKLRKHDIVVGGFMSVVRRRGQHAIEYQQVRTIWDQHGQALFDFVEPPKLAAK